jgi:hypothetical protein
MLTLILIAGLVWMALAMIFVFSLAAAARSEDLPSAVAPPAELPNPVQEPTPSAAPVRSAKPRSRKKSAVASSHPVHA